MESCKKNDKVNQQEGLILTLTLVVVEIHPLLQEEGLGLKNGLIFLTEERSKCELIQEKLTMLGAVFCKSFSRTKMLRNYQMGFRKYSHYDKESEILDYLEPGKFVPCLLVTGFVPDFLRGEKNLVPFEKVGFDVDKIMNDLQGFRQFARTNPDRLQYVIRRFKTSQIYLERNGESEMQMVMILAANVFCEYYRDRSVEFRTRLKRQEFGKAIRYCMELAEKYTECDTLEAIKKSIEQYVEQHTEVMICRITEIGGKETEAIKEKNIILFDHDFYYIYEEMARKACENLLELVSFPNIKKQLYQEGVITCNYISGNNYTVGRVLTNAYGQSIRERFLVFRKEFFMSVDSLGLEERRGECECISENLQIKCPV